MTWPSCAWPGEARLSKTLRLFPSLGVVQKAILKLGEGRAVTSGEISQLNFLLGEIFANAALAACKKFRVAPAQVDVIGSHGQTIFHQGTPTRFNGQRVASTLQIGEPSVIAARTGITTVGDFRPADVAAGGQGAPLVPFVDFLLYRHPRIGRVALNIGGIANVTVIPAGAKLEDVFAFDTGPGNMVIDALVRHFTGGRKGFDRNAEMAVMGKLLPGLLQSLLRDKYFSKLPPKTAGREQYGEKYMRALLSHRDVRNAKPEDVIRTATILAALSILGAFHNFIGPKTKIGELIVSGGGAHNPLLMAQIESGLNGVRVRDAGELGVPGDAKEAFAFRRSRERDAAQTACECAGRDGSEESGRTGQGMLCRLGEEVEEVQEGKEVEERERRTTPRAG